MYNHKFEMIFPEKKLFDSFTKRQIYQSKWGMLNPKSIELKPQKKLNLPFTLNFLN